MATKQKKPKAQKPEAENKLKKRIQVVKLLVINGDKTDQGWLHWKQRTKVWRAIADDVKRLTNAFYRLWLVAHTKAGNSDTVKAYVESVQIWHNAKALHSEKKGADPGPKPKLPVVALSPQMASELNKSIGTMFSHINERVRSLVIHELTRKLNGESSKSAYPKWIRALCDDGEFPNTSRAQPILFDSRNGKLIAPLNDSSAWQFGLRIDRLQENGKRATSTEDTLTLKTFGRRLAKQRVVLEKIVAGDFKFCGSRLCYNETTNEWWVHLCYQMPDESKPVLDALKQAVLVPGKNRPFMFRVDGRRWFLGGRTGDHITHVRRQLLQQRRGIQESYRHAGSARKGHGRRRALGKLPLLTNRWKDFVKTVNNQTISAVVRRCVEAGVGTLTYFQPTGHFADSRFNASAGKLDGKVDSSSWDWYQLGSILERKCEEAGIKCQVKKYGDKYGRKSRSA